jgi:membrane-associated HD superfamily phosphohydrolase
MKIEIDLDDILGDENGTETLQESVRRQVITAVSANVKKGIGEKIDRAISETITNNIQTFLKDQMPLLLGDLMDAEYAPVGRYGDKEKPTSFRKQMLKTIEENMVYKKDNYSSDTNAFTRAVDDVIEQHMKLFKADFNKKVDADFTAAAMQYATEALKKKLGILS